MLIMFCRKILFHSKDLGEKKIKRGDAQESIANKQIRKITWWCVYRGEKFMSK